MTGLPQQVRKTLAEGATSLTRGNLSEPPSRHGAFPNQPSQDDTNLVGSRKSVARLHDEMDGVAISRPEVRRSPR